MLTLKIKLILAAIALAGLAGGGWYVYHHIYQSGFDASNVISDKKRAVERATALEELTKANEIATLRERSITKTLSDTSIKHVQEQENADSKIKALQRDVRSGAMRLSIALSGAGSHCPAPGADSTAAGGPGDEAQTRSLREAVANIIDIGADGNRAVRQLNGCIDSYNAVRDQYNNKEK